MLEADADAFRGTKCPPALPEWLEMTVAAFVLLPDHPSGASLFDLGLVATM